MSGIIEHLKYLSHPEPRLTPQEAFEKHRHIVETAAEMPLPEAERYINERKEHGLPTHVFYYPSLALNSIRQQILCWLDPDEYIGGHEGYVRRGVHPNFNPHYSLFNRKH